MLNGGGSTVSAAGNILTLTLALTFQPSFIGQKNIYMDAANPYETVNWQQEGTWFSAPVPAISVTPSSGIATQQTFSLQVTDGLGVTDLSTVGILLNSTTGTAGACAVTYNRAQNALMLSTDAGAQPAEFDRFQTRQRDAAEQPVRVERGRIERIGVREHVDAQRCVEFPTCVQRSEELIRRGDRRLSDGELAAAGCMGLAAGCDYGSDSVVGRRRAAKVQLPGDGFPGSRPI